MSTPANRPVRRLAAVWFADIVGYTRLSSMDENAALRVVSILQEASRRIITEHDGHLVKFIGDAVFAEFTSLDMAVRSALALRDEFASACTAQGLSNQVRVAVHAGEVVIAPDGDLYGDGVNTAARLQGEAAPGQVIVSQDVWRQLRQRQEYRFQSLGERSLKGLAGHLWIFAVELASTTSGAISGDPDEVFQDLPRPRKLARLVRVVPLYLAAAAITVQAVAVLRAQFDLPTLMVPLAIVLLIIGLIVILSTAWVQSRPVWERAASQPGPWHLDLEGLADSVARRRFPSLTWARALLGGVGAFALLFVFAIGYTLLKDHPSFFKPQIAYSEPDRAIAILPFQVHGTDTAFWQEGMLDLLALNLNGAVGLRVIDPRSVLSHLRGQGEATADAEAAHTLGRELGARFTMTGQILVDSTRLEVLSRVHDLETGEISEARVEGTTQQIAVLVDRLGAEVLRGGLLPEGRNPPSLSVGRLASASLPALRYYLAGERALRNSRWEEAAVHFRQAAYEDSTFALALQRLSMVTGWSVQPHVPRRDPYGEAAERFAERLPERYALLVRGHAQLNRGSRDAIRTLELLTQRYPDDVDGWFLLGDAYYHLRGSGRGEDHRFQDALLRTLELDPAFGPAHLHLIEFAVANDDLVRAKELLERYQRVDPRSPLLSSLMHTVSQATRAEAVHPRPDGTGSISREVTPEQREGDAARSLYTSALRNADSARNRAAGTGVMANDPIFRRADSTRTVATELAARRSYRDAARLLDQSRLGYDDARLTARWRVRLDSARFQVAQARSAVAGSERTAEGSSWETRAESAERSGRYEEALSAYGRAGTIYALIASESRETAGRATPPSAPTASAPRAADRSADAEAGVNVTLASLKRAIESKDLGALREVWTGLSPAEVRNFQTAFRSMRDLRVTFEVRSIRPLNDQVVASVHTTYDYFNETSQRAAHQSFVQELHIAQQGGRWVILASRGN